MMDAVRPEDTARALLERAAREIAESEKRAGTLLEKVRSTVPDSAARFGIKRVYLFGSLAWGGVHSRSDVDLATEGLKPVDRASFAAELSRKVGMDIDVVLLESAPPELKERVVRDGEILYRG
ncbi:MAG: nucleotidyltransferase domain-containing protein, partial [Deltaproteobacteria bacterium]